MQELIDEIEELKSSIDAYVAILLKNDEIEIMENMQHISVALSAVLPRVVAVYEDERMQPYKEDQQYWLMQLKRILDALGRQDQFLAVDALKYELHANLTYLQGLLQQNIM